jgi:protease PrsW
MTAPMNTSPQGAGWYPDPWQVAAWRWWDGYAWSAATSTLTGVSAAGPPKPLLPSWLSPAVLVSMIFVIPGTILLTLSSPISIVLGLVPLVIVFPVLAWLDRIEPEPRSSRIHALLWGACVAPLVAIIVNTAVGAAANEAVAAVVSAPVIEEIMKGLGVLWAVRRREVDDVMDGIVYAGWVGLGFAITEDFLYFTNAHESGQLAGVFIVRALLTPFAHPLFTAWIGLAVGIAVHRRRSVLTAWWGLLLAIGTHAMWNGSLTLTDETGNATILLVAAAAFVLLFTTAVIACVRVRSWECKRFISTAPAIAQRYGLRADEVAVFSSWPQVRAVRRTLSRSQRRSFDALHGSMARLSAMLHRPGSVDPVDEARLAEVLTRSRDLLRSGAPAGPLAPPAMSSLTDALDRSGQVERCEDGFGE